MLNNQEYRTLADRLIIPNNTQAILWDMDGVLIDSLGFDYSVCNELVQSHCGITTAIPDAFIQSIFAYHPPEFWRRIFAYLQKRDEICIDDHTAATILQAYEKQRQARAFTVLPGVEAILQTAKTNHLSMAVVSNNPTADVQELLQRSGILDYFDAVIGNDISSVEKKPAPDTYLFAAKKLGVDAQYCVVIEDSLVGLEAGSRAGCHTVAVATGGTTLATLSASSNAKQTYTQFATMQAQLCFGNVLNKTIDTPNDFVSHMIEHIAWRLGMEIQLQWHHDHWLQLGTVLGNLLSLFPRQKQQAATLGMIDDGSAEVVITIGQDTPGVTFTQVKAVNLDWFLSCRCEQINSGTPLLDLLQGLAHALKAKIEITICSAEDPHHTWEGIFRCLGLALKKLEFSPLANHNPSLPPEPPPQEQPSASTRDVGRMVVTEKTTHFCQISRKTAESDLTLTVDFSATIQNQFTFEISDSIQVDNLARLLEQLAQAAGFTMQLHFKALALSSSHVVLEDTALVLGKALLEILSLRMVHSGANCSGSSVQKAEDVRNQTIRLGLSVEGRKFCLFVPVQHSFATLREQFLVGHTVLEHLRSEDLDDFIDGLAGGLACSIIVHFHAIPPANQGWQQIFTHLGTALRETFAENVHRKGVPAGVKATLL